MDKKILKEKMENFRFNPITDETFHIYNQYELLCNSVGEKDPDILFLFFYKGETYFRLGDYRNSQKLLNKCIIQSDQTTPVDLLAKCHNVLGLIYTAMGYELMAMENYLLSIDYASAAQDYRNVVITQINIGWMYRDLGDNDTALEYFYKCLANINTLKVDGAYSLWELCLSYIGQINFKMGNFDKGVQVMDQIHKMRHDKSQVFYEVVAQNMNIRGYAYLKDDKMLRETVDFALENAKQQEDFLEFSEAYFDICDFLMTINREDAKRFIDVLKIHCEKTNLPFLNLKLKRLEVKYAKEFLDRQTYLEQCASYFDLYQDFRLYDQDYKINNLLSIKALQKERKEKNFYKEKSKYDLMTGLLNKVSFTQTVTATLNSSNSKNLSCAFAIVDIDKFKAINDHYGHISGDDFITETAAQMRNTFSDSAILGRIGGDEFGVFWPNAYDEIDIKNQLHNFHKMLEFNHVPSGVDAKRLSVSVGLVFSHLPDTYTSLFEKADQAMYFAKHNGRNQTAIYNELL